MRRHLDKHTSISSMPWWNFVRQIQSLKPKQPIVVLAGRGAPGTPARRAACVVPNPPWCTTQEQRGNSQVWGACSRCRTMQNLLLQQQLRLSDFCGELWHVSEKHNRVFSRIFFRAWCEIQMMWNSNISTLQLLEFGCSLAWSVH